MSQKKVTLTSTTSDSKQEEEIELRRGPWTLEEDNLLINYIACHGEGRWNLLARSSGLKRTGKSCRLRWLNYLKPDIKRGNLSPEEQFLILELHSKWGNRWSRIAQHLPGRTDNEIKNYWRTRVQKQARQLKVDANSTMFRDAVRCYWMPRLLEKMGSSQLPHESLEQNLTSTSNIEHHNLAELYDLSSINPNPNMIQFPHETSSSPSTSSQQPMNGSNFTISQANELNSMIIDKCVNNDVSFGLDGMDWSQVSASNQIDNYNSMVNSIEDHGIWSLDELWHVRKVNEWGGI